MHMYLNFSILISIFEIPWKSQSEKSQQLILLVFLPQNLESLNISFFSQSYQLRENETCTFREKQKISCRNRREIKGTRKFWPVCHCPIHNHATNRSQPPKINMAEIWNFIITSNVLNYCLSTVAWANKCRSVFSIQNELWVWIPSPRVNKIEQTVYWFKNKTL